MKKESWYRWIAFVAITACLMNLPTLADNIGDPPPANNVSGDDNAVVGTGNVIGAARQSDDNQIYGDNNTIDGNNNYIGVLYNDPISGNGVPVAPGWEGANVPGSVIQSDGNRVDGDSNRFITGSKNIIIGDWN